MSFEKNVKQVISFEYDFDIDGGATGVKVMRPEAVNVLRPGLVVEYAEVKILTAFTSGGSATVIIGSIADDDGFFTNIFSQALNTVKKGDGALASGSYIVPGTPNGDKITTWPIMTVGTAALTAGKIKVDFHCYLADV